MEIEEEDPGETAQVFFVWRDKFPFRAKTILDDADKSHSFYELRVSPIMTMSYRNASSLNLMECMSNRSEGEGAPALTVPKSGKSVAVAELSSG